MAHPLNDLINRREGRTATNCNSQCVYWKYPHLDKACVLSDVFSVKKDEPFFEFKKQKEQPPPLAEKGSDDV